MGLHRNRLDRLRTRLERNLRPDPNWEAEERYTSSCTLCGTTWWAHLTPRINCPTCGGWCVVTDTYEEAET